MIMGTLTRTLKFYICMLFNDVGVSIYMYTYIFISMRATATLYNSYWPETAIYMYNVHFRGY